MCEGLGLGGGITKGEKMELNEYAFEILDRIATAQEKQAHQMKRIADMLENGDARVSIYDIEKEAIDSLLLVHDR